MTVDITGAADLYAYQFDFAFDPGILSVTSLSEGSFLQNSGATLFVPGSIDNVAGTVSNTADTLQTAISGASGSGILVTFDFTAIGTGSSAVTLSNLFLLDSNLSSLNGTTQGGSISVGGNTTVPEPSSAALLLIGLLAVLVNMSGLHRVFIGRFFRNVAIAIVLAFLFTSRAAAQTAPDLTGSRNGAEHVAQLEDVDATIRIELHCFRPEVHSNSEFCSKTRSRGR